jgi:hypothetical protein
MKRDGRRSSCEENNSCPFRPLSAYCERRSKDRAIRATSKGCHGDRKRQNHTDADFPVPVALLKVQLSKGRGPLSRPPFATSQINDA